MFGWKKKPRDTEPPLSEADRRDLQLSAYLDDDLSAAERDALESSLLAEPQLADALQGMRQIKDTLASLETVRAPRSFAIEAPATPVSARSRFGRFELVARFGAVAAAVAFAAVLFGDVAGPTVTRTSSDTAAGGTSASAAAESSLSAELYSATPEIEAATDDSAADGASDRTLAEAAPVDPIATSSALVAPATASPAPSEATASLESAAPDASPQPANTGGDVAAVSAGNGATTDSPGDASTDSTTAPDPVEEPGEASAPPDTAVEDLPNRTVDADTESTGTDSQPPTLATQVQELSGGAAASQPSPTDEALSPFEADEDGISALATTLGAATAILASASVLLWWQRKRTTDPA